MAEKKTYPEVKTGEVLLKVENLSQHFGPLKAVDNVSFEIKKGEVFGLVGESGCGKTTTGRTIIKLYDATGGNVYFKGQRIGAGTLTYKEAIKEAKAKNYNLVIIDTAGRLAIDEAMMKEIAAIKEAVNPTETLFVVDAMTGQDAVNTAREFNERLDFNGVVLTKLDGDTRGGAALSIRTVVNKPIKFVGTGEKLDAVDQFHPSRMADRILGMGDIVSLVERAQEQYDEEEAKRLQKKIQKNQFDFNDFMSQIQ